jgi:aspartyl protease family protein
MRGEHSFDEAGAGGRTIAWACRQAAIWGAIALVLYLATGYRDRLLPRESAPVAAPAPAAAPSAAVRNTLAFPADAQGHFQLDADVDGATVHFIVDTGATLVTLSPADAEAAGISPGSLDFTMVMNTANGRVRAAPVTLREVRIGQFALDDVQAAVVENLSVSLLGMSFLSRLDRWQMQDGTLTISW